MAQKDSTVLIYNTPRAVTEYGTSITGVICLSAFGVCATTRTSCASCTCWYELVLWSLHYPYYCRKSLLLQCPLLISSPSQAYDIPPSTRIVQYFELMGSTVGGWPYPFPVILQFKYRCSQYYIQQRTSDVVDWCDHLHFRT